MLRQASGDRHSAPDGSAPEVDRVASRRQAQYSDSALGNQMPPDKSADNRSSGTTDDVALGNQESFEAGIDIHELAKLALASSDSQTLSDPPPLYSWVPGDLPTDTTTAEYVAKRKESTLPDTPQVPVARAPRMSIVIFIVGSRGDVQPYLALALHMIIQHGHRVRIATHPTFKHFVLGENARLRNMRGSDGESLEGELEFFDAGGDPKSLMEYMVKNPGLMPGMESLTNGDVGRKQAMAAEMLNGFYRSTYAPDPVSGRPFAADAVISNPPTFAHFHVVEALGIPLHMSFTMPWTASKAFPHPLMGSNRSNMSKSMANYLGFGVADRLMWQGLGGEINNFRKRQLLLGHLHARIAPSVLDELKVPWTYCWSPSLLPKPDDWRSNIDISGFYFLDNDEAYNPPPDLAAFLRAGPPPAYIGFGSVPIPEPENVTDMLFAAINQAGVRAIISSGWAGLGKNREVPHNIFVMTSDVPHEWLFSNGRVSAVVHHGGAGTTACGLRHGRPTAIIPFFGDQKFWGDAVFGAGAGPAPIPFKKLTLQGLTGALRVLCDSEVIRAAEAIGEGIRREKGEEKGVDSFHRHLPLNDMRCDIDDTRVATLYDKRYELRLSTVAAGILLEERLIAEKDLVAYRSKEYDTTRHNFDPARGLLYGTINATVTGVNGVTQLFYNPREGLKNTFWGIPRDTLAIYGDLYEGFDNLPTMMGGVSRRREKVTGFGSGCLEGAKSLSWGFYDGVVGLVTEPIEGAKKEGGIGIAKGCGRGAMNLLVRPTAGLLGFMALPAQGAVRSVRKANSGIVDPRDILRGPRIELSKAATRSVSNEARRSIISRFRSIKGDTLTRKKRVSDEIQWVLRESSEERTKMQVEPSR